MIVSACVSFLWSRRVSRSNSAMRVSRTSFGGAFGPRFTDPVPANAPAAPCRRQVLRLDEYNPSRRNKAPTSPTFLHLSASLTIRRLYSPLNRRRVAFSATSGSGPSPVRPAAPRATPVALRAPSVPRDAVCRGGPRALAHDRQAGALDDEMDGVRGRDATEHDSELLTPPRACGVVRRVQIGAHQGQDRPHEPVRLEFPILSLNAGRRQRCVPPIVCPTLSRVWKLSCSPCSTWPSRPQSSVGPAACEP